jgi:MFS family permease
MLRALRHRDFALLWVGQAVSLVGDGVYLVAIAWLVYDLSNAPGALALVGFAWTLPQVATLLVAGVLSDRRTRGRLRALLARPGRGERGYRERNRQHARGVGSEPV